MLVLVIISNSRLPELEGDARLRRQDGLLGAARRDPTPRSQIWYI